MVRADNSDGDDDRNESLLSHHCQLDMVMMMLILNHGRCGGNDRLLQFAGVFQKFCVGGDRIPQWHCQSLGCSDWQVPPNSPAQ
eukprot:1381634-Prorocentrum_lima.AAC.1